MLIYPLDLDQPYIIIDHDPKNETYTVSGSAKIMRSTRWVEKHVEFGGHNSIFTVTRDQLLTEPQKRQLRWVRRHLGDKHHDTLKKEICDFVIASHICIDT